MAKEGKAAKGKKSEAIVMMTPDGRLINGHLFVKNAFKDERTGKESAPRYRIEMAWSKTDKEFGKFLDDVFNHCVDKFGDKIYLHIDEPVKGYDEVRSPIIDGDDVAKRRRKRGKDKNEGYDGMWIIRADTAFNFEGIDADGGIAVYGMDTEPVSAMDKGEVYNGSYGQAKLELSFYEDNEGNPSAKFYLKAYQKVDDGEKLASVVDHSSSFQKRSGGRASEEEGGRRQRRG